jgi:hypothetical protein
MNEWHKAQAEKRHADLFATAHAAGMAAGEAAAPTPMHVVRRDVVTGQITKRYAPVMDGVCGFAWINVRPGNSPFANWLKKNTHASPAYQGGVEYWVREFNQSMERKEAFARAFARVLQEAGITAYAGSRMD